MTLSSTTTPLATAHDLVMLDLDGVVYRGRHAVPGASAALRSLEVPIAYLTNNASRPPQTVAEHLRSLDMPLGDDGDVITSAQAIARVMAEELDDGAPVLVVGGEGLRQALGEQGLTVVGPDEDPVAVVQGFDRRIGWEQLAEASYAIAGGARWYVSNTDRTVPTDRGVAPGNGSLVAAVAAAVKAEPVVAGKPHRPLFEETLRRTAAENPLMVGDRLDTDIAGARAAGIVSLWVATGVDDLEAVVAAEGSLRPDFVGPDLAALHAEHPEVQIEADTARCGDVVVTVEDASLRLVQGRAGTIEALRAAVTLGWDRVDGGHDAPVPDATLDA